MVRLTMPYNLQQQVACILQISLNIVTLCLYEMYINKSDDSFYGIALAILSKLTKHKIDNFT